MANIRRQSRGRDGTYRLRSLHPRTVSGLHTGLQHKKCRNTGISTANRLCDWPGAWSQDTILADLQPPRSRADDAQSLHREKLSKWVHTGVIIIGSSTDSVCQEEWWRPKALWRLLGHQLSNHQKSVSPPIDLRYVQQTMRSSYVYQTGCAVRLPSHSDQRRHLVQDSIPNPVRSVWIPSYACSLDHCAGQVQGLLGRLLAAQHGRLRGVLPRPYTHLLDNWERAQSACTKSATVPAGIRSLLQSQRILVWNVRRRVPWINRKFGMNLFGNGPNIHKRRLGQTEISSGGATCSRINKLLPQVYP